ncbi:MAG TPA: aminotransferase class V-fold PLP-dependent enzyme [Gemmatimonadaceae bacterium]|nr:aminotransferase class V-fold PLP-dependent enzyme [Gemmatimonadaceae bacterium]
MIRPTSDAVTALRLDAERAVLARAGEIALDYLSTLDAASVATTTPLAELRRRFDRPLQDGGTDPVAVVEELARGVEGGLLNTAGGRFYGWVIGAGLPAAVGADVLTTVWDQNAGLYACSPAAAVVEEVAGAWLKTLFGVPPHASFALVTGCQMAHVTCLAAARHALLDRRGVDVNVAGLAGAPPINVVTSDAAHGTTMRALKLLGIGTGNVIVIPTDESSQLRAPQLAEALTWLGDAPTIVVLQAGDVNAGVFDPFEELIPIAHAAGAWVHVDGAMGLWANATPTHRHLLKGAERADSWASDGHKWLNVPYDCGYAFVAHPGHHRAGMEHRAAYLVHASDVRDEMDWTPEHSRRARGFATWAALRQLGRAGVADLVDRCVRHAKAIVSGIAALPGATVMAEPTINQGMVRFLDPAPGATEQDHDAYTDRVAAAINATGEAYFTNTTWRGKRCMRVSVSSWRTTERDVARAVRAAERVLRELAPDEVSGARPATRRAKIPSRA